jgi:hypothetical protein
MSIRTLLRHAVGDPGNPLFEVERRFLPRRSNGGALAAILRRKGATLAASVFVVATIAIAIGHPDPRQAALVGASVKSGLAVQVAIAYLLSIERARAVHRSLILGRRIEPWLMTELTPAELLRGAIVPSTRAAWPWAAIAAATAILWPILLGGGLMRFFVFAALVIEIALTHAAATWIAFGFFARRLSRRAIALAFAGLLILDPFWFVGGASLALDGGPLAAFLIALEAIYALVKIVWARLVIFDLAIDPRDWMIQDP